MNSYIQPSIHYLMGDGKWFAQTDNKTSMHSGTFKVNQTEDLTMEYSSLVTISNMKNGYMDKLKFSLDKTDPVNAFSTALKATSLTEFSMADSAGNN